MMHRSSMTNFEDSTALAMLPRYIWLTVTLTIPGSTGCYIWLPAGLHAAWLAVTFTIQGSTGCYIWLPARLLAAETPFWKLSSEPLLNLRLASGQYIPSHKSVGRTNIWIAFCTTTSVFDSN